MPKLSNFKQEEKAIASILRSPQDVSSRIIAGLDTDDFFEEHCRAFWRRTKALFAEKGRPPRWDDLISDPDIASKHRKLMEESPERSIKNLDDAKALVGSLNRLRKMRQLWYMGTDLLQTLGKGDGDEDRLDLDKLLDKVGDALAQARIDTDFERQFIHLGRDDNAREIIRELLDGEALSFIPTGFKAFDTVNMGIPRGSFMILGGPTGAGKSLVAGQLSDNITDAGHDCCTVSLEMTAKENLQRFIARNSSLDITQLNDARTRVKPHEADAAYQKYRDYRQHRQKHNVRNTIWSPEDDVSIEQVLAVLKPYKYDVIIIDYVGLLKGMSTEDQWRKLGDAARTAKRFAMANDCAVIFLVQVTDEGAIRYSQMMKEHSDLAWIWKRTEESRTTGLVEIIPVKARKQEDIPFYVRMDRRKMTVKDVEQHEIDGLRKDKKKDDEKGQKATAKPKYQPQQESGKRNKSGDDFDF